MLGKLFKTEFKASGRLYLPIFIGLLFCAVVERIMIEIQEAVDGSTVLNIMFGVITVIFVIIIISVCVSGQFISIYRFHKSVFTDEGYLTNTLPVKSSSIIISKLLVGVLYTIFSYIVLFVSAFIMVAGDTLIKAIQFIKTDIGIENTQIGLVEYILTIISDIPLTTVLVIALIIASLFFNILMFYISFAIGNMANNKKVLLSVIIYIGITNVLSFVTSGIVILIGEGIDTAGMSLIAIGNLTLAIILVVIVLLGLVFYFVTNKIIKSKLNLE